jgi:hypothetical protein
MMISSTKTGFSLLKFQYFEVASGERCHGYAAKPAYAFEELSSSNGCVIAVIICKQQIWRHNCSEVSLILLPSTMHELLEYFFSQFKQASMTLQQI